MIRNGEVNCASQGRISSPAPLHCLPSFMGGRGDRVILSRKDHEGLAYSLEQFASWWSKRQRPRFAAVAALGVIMALLKGPWLRSG